MTKDKIQKLLETDDDLAVWFQLLCENGPQAIEAQAWQFVAVLSERNEEATITEVTDALFDLAHELCPDSLAGADEAADERRQDLYRHAIEWASKLPAGGQQAFADALEDGFQDAWESSLHGFRHYLKGCCSVALGAARGAA